jgi:hypothetical protein
MISDEQTTSEQPFVVVQNEVFDVVLPGETLVVSVLYFACAIVALIPSIIRVFFASNALKLAAFGPVPILV